MPPAPVLPIDEGIEPELRTPPPRHVRLRAGMVKWEWLGWTLAALMIIGPVAYGILPDYLVARYGEVVPAEVTYTLDPSEFSKATPAKWLLAHLTYEWRGVLCHDTRRIPADLLKRFRSHTTFPVKVLRPWRARLWGVDWRNRQPVDPPARWLALSGMGALLAWIGVSAWRAQKRLVREGVPVSGRVMRYENWWHRPILGPLPERGFMRVHYEYPPPGSQPRRAGDLPPVSGRATLFLPANLPTVAGGPVTILIRRRGAQVRHGLYAASLYEAVLPLAPTPAPDPGSG